MEIDEVRDYCVLKKGVKEEFVFNHIHLGFKVKGKIFLLASLEGVLSVTLKCSPSWSAELRNRYSAVQPAYYFNSRHWNNVYIDGSISKDLLRKMIDHSYDLVVAGLSKRLRLQLK